MNTVTKSSNPKGGLEKWNLGLTILALVFTMIFGVISYLSTNQLFELSTNTTTLSTTAVRNSEISLALSNLTSSNAARSYIANSQKQASLNNPSLVLPNVKGGYELTPAGKTILIKVNLWDDVASLAKSSPQLPISEIILSLGVDRLYNNAISQKLTTAELIGVVSTLIEQSR